MGCDIHAFIEIKIHLNEWKDVSNYKRNFYYKNDSVYEQPFTINEPDLSSRNYLTFSYLANVRNYNNLPFISDPKGLPDDVSEGIKSEHDRWIDDAHSASYVSLKEICDFIKEHDKTEFEHVIYSTSPLDLRTLKNFVDVLSQRLIDENRYVVDFDVNNNAENIRLVFWFDN